MPPRLRCPLRLQPYLNFPAWSSGHLHRNPLRLFLAQREFVALDRHLDGVSEGRYLLNPYLFTHQYPHVHEPSFQGTYRAYGGNPALFPRPQLCQIHRPTSLTIIFIARPRAMAILDSSTLRRTGPPPLFSISTVLPILRPMSSTRQSQLQPQYLAPDSLIVIISAF